MVTSSVAPPPEAVLKGLRKWFDQRFGQKLMNMGNTLERPHQTDTYSCSICAMSTIAHGVFGDPLWQQHSASTHRLSWLLKIDKFDRSCLSVGRVSKLHSYGLCALMLGLHRRSNYCPVRPNDLTTKR